MMMYSGGSMHGKSLFCGIILISRIKFHKKNSSISRCMKDKEMQKVSVEKTSKCEDEKTLIYTLK